MTDDAQSEMCDTLSLSEGTVSELLPKDNDGHGYVESTQQSPRSALMLVLQPGL